MHAHTDAREAHVPIALAPPLRPFRAEDAAIVARLNDAASMGIVLNVWTEMAGPDGDPWEVGRNRQIERMESGQVMVVLDPGAGVEAAMLGNPVPPGPESTEGVPRVFHPLIELEHLVPDAWYLNVIGTLPEARRKGHAARLLGAAEEIARAGGHEDISLIVSDANTVALAVYDAWGYDERARRRQIKEGPGAGVPGEDWILMVKPVG